MQIVTLEHGVQYIYLEEKKYTKKSMCVYMHFLLASTGLIKHNLATHSPKAKKRKKQGKEKWKDYGAISTRGFGTEYTIECTRDFGRLKPKLQVPKTHDYIPTGRYSNITIHRHSFTQTDAEPIVP